MPLPDFIVTVLSPFGAAFTQFPFRTFRNAEIRKRLTESFPIKPSLSRLIPGDLLVN
jgi:hypothetical protein